MKRLMSLPFLMLFALLASSCGDRYPVAPVESELDELDAHRWGYYGSNRSVTVMTRNVYVGADVDAVIAALMTQDPLDDLDALADAIQTFVMTDFPSRARALADEVARSRPLVIGLQEVSEVTISIPPGVPDLPEDGVDIDVDFLPILEAALAARHLHYEVAVSIKNIEAVPVLPIPGAFVSLVDYDVIMIDRAKVKVRDTFAKTFDHNIGPVAEGVSLTRGWLLLEAKIRGRPYAFVNTHLESGHQDPSLTQLRLAQAAEIVTELGARGITDPTIVMGDLNDYPGTPMYGLFVAAGFVDMWDAIKPGTNGYTCCHLKDLSNVVANFDRRIDYVLARGFGQPRGNIYRIGWLPWQRVQGPFYKLWASDHAGLVATVRPGGGWHVAQ